MKENFKELVKKNDVLSKVYKAYTTSKLEHIKKEHALVKQKWKDRAITLLV